jgi:hydroxymethylpyrimidine/phosphomethylpyrimidine kinase
MLTGTGVKDDLRTMPTADLSKQRCITDITDDQVTERGNIHSFKFQRKLVQPRLRDIQQGKMLC